MPEDAVTETASRTGGLLLDLQTDLVAANEIKASPTRDELLETVDDLMLQLDSAVTGDDAAWVAEITETYDTLEQLIAFHQDAALDRWASWYADFLAQLGMVADPTSGPGRRARLYLTAYARSSRYLKASALQFQPQELMDLFVLCLEYAGEQAFGLRSRDVREVTALKVLTSDDLLPLPLVGVYPAAARTAVERYEKVLRLRALATRIEEEQPGILGTVWSVVGWDSFSDFAFDVGLVVVTGGAGAVVKWGRTAARGARAIDRARDAKRLLRVADRAAEELRHLDEAMAQVRSRVAATAGRSRGGRAVQAAERLVRRQYTETLRAFLRYATEAVKAAEARADLRQALDEAWKVLSAVLNAQAAPQLLQIVSGAGAGDKSPVQLTIAEIHDLSTKLAVDGIHNLGRRIEEAKDMVAKALIVGSGSLGRRYLKWLYLLVVRQVAVKIVVLVTQNRGTPVRPKQAAVLLSSAFAGAVAETLSEFKVPWPLVQRALDHVEDLLARTAIGLIEGVVDDFFRSGSATTP